MLRLYNYRLVSSTKLDLNIGLYHRYTMDKLRERLRSDARIVIFGNIDLFEYEKLKQIADNRKMRNITNVNTGCVYSIPVGMIDRVKVISEEKELAEIDHWIYDSAIPPIYIVTGAYMSELASLDRLHINALILYKNGCADEQMAKIYNMHNLGGLYLFDDFTDACDIIQSGEDVQKGCWENGEIVSACGYCNTYSLVKNEKSCRENKDV
jgi:hypothetical protein